MDEVLDAARKLKDFLWQYASALYMLWKLTRIPPDYDIILGEQMTLNRKAIIASTILLFLARGLHGIIINEIWGAVLVTAIFVALLFLFSAVGSLIAWGKRQDEQTKKRATDWSSLAIVLWAVSLALVIVADAIAFAGGPPIDLWLGKITASLLISILSLGIILITKWSGRSTAKQIVGYLFITVANSILIYFLVYVSWA
jgi:hypothetical protein